MATLKTSLGETIEFREEIHAVGAVKDVYLSVKGDKVAAFYRSHPGRNAYERLSTIVGDYRERILSIPYWAELFCWPEALVEHKGKLGVVAPVYDRSFYFEYGSKNQDYLGIRGREKEGKWFASAFNQSKYLDERERGDWKAYLSVCELIARAVRKMHAAGLAHSDLSYKNVLIDPVGVHACIIDIDGLVVPGKFPPEVAGTPDFIAPEVMATMHLPLDHPDRVLPSIATDRHALAVMVYMYLFYRHPLRGGRVHHPDPQIDETMLMGTKATFVEHKHNLSNRPNLKNISPAYLPWADVQRIPYTASGPYLSPLFERAFVDGLHQPRQRPSADEWEKALQYTKDVLLPCRSPDCKQKFFVYNETVQPECPFCRTPWTSGPFPYLYFYAGQNERKLMDAARMVVLDNTSLHTWHVHRHIRPDERLSESDALPVARFFRGGDYLKDWKMQNLRLPELHDENKVIPIGGDVDLVDGLTLGLSFGRQARVMSVKIVPAPDRIFRTVVAK